MSRVTKLHRSVFEHKVVSLLKNRGIHSHESSESHKNRFTGKCISRHSTNIPKLCWFVIWIVKSDPSIWVWYTVSSTDNWTPSPRDNGGPWQRPVPTRRPDRGLHSRSREDEVPERQNLRKSLILSSYYSLQVVKLSKRYSLYCVKDVYIHF